MAQDKAQTSAESQDEATAETAPAVADSGTAKYDTYLVQGNDALSHYAINLWRRNPELQAQFPEVNGKVPLYGKGGVIKFLVDFNNNLPKADRPQGWQHIDTRGDVNCDGIKGRSPHVNLGQLFVYPELANEILNPGKPCAKITELEPEAPLAVRAARRIVREEVEAPVVTRAQFMPTARNAAEEGMAVDTLLAFFGTPPRDTAKEFGVKKDRLSRNLEPGLAEGTRVNTDDTAFEPRRGSETLDLRRAEKELEFKPERHIDYTRDAQGRLVAVGPTKGTHTKIESSMRVVDSGVGAVRDLGALIGEGRRFDPDFANIFREGRTARNVIDPLLNTGEGAKAVVTLVGTSRAIGNLSAAFEQEPTTQTGEYLIQQYLKRASNKLFWSVDPMGAPVGDVEGTRAAITAVLAKIPEADRAGMEAKYKPYLPLIGTDRDLALAIKADPNRPNWFDEGADWARERVGLDYIRDGFGRPPGYDKHREGKKERAQHALKELTDRYYDAEIASTGISTDFERELGSGTAMLDIPAAAREASSLSPARVKLLTGIAADDKQFGAYVDHLVSLPGGTQAVTDLLLYTSNKGSLNHDLLGFATDGEGRRESKRILTDLLGEAGKDNLYKEGRGFGNGLLRTITLGIVSKGKGRNVNTGVFDENEIIRARLADPATRDVTLGAIREVMTRAAAAEGSTPGGVATTALTLPLDRDWAENQFGPGGSPALNTLRDLTGPEGRKTMDAQVLYNLDHAGDRNVTAGVALKMNIAAFANPDAYISTSDVDKMRAAMTGGTVTVAPGDPAAGGTLTAIDVSAAVEAARAGKPFASALPQIADRNSKLVTSASIDSWQVSTLARLDPVNFTVLVAQAIASGDPQAGGLVAAVKTLGGDKGGYAKDLKEIIDNGVKALKAAKGNPDAEAAAINAIRSNTQAFVSGDKAAAGRIAVNELAGVIIAMPGALAGVVAGNVGAKRVVAGGGVFVAAP